MIMMGLLSAVAIYIFLLKLPTNARQRLLGIDLVLDIIVTITLMIMFAGTYSGMAAAVFGGLIFSGLLIVSKALFGYQKAVWLQGKIVWLHIKPIWRRP